MASRALRFQAATTPHSLAAHQVVPMAPAIGDIFLVAANLDLGALARDLALTVQAHDHRRLAAAMADGAHLAQLVGNRQQRHRAREQLALEIRTQTIGHDRNADTVGDAGELPDLPLIEELRLVDKDAGDL